MSPQYDGDLLTRVGPGTPMGTLFRRYWLPALKSSELTRDGDPVRFMLLGEKLLAFRDTHSRVGVMDHRCPHRCASLFFGRNEEGGLRCVYHGWKFDVEAHCLEMANVPPHQDFRHKVHAKAYKAAERNGVIWVYMGAGDAPPLPAFEAYLLPESEIAIEFAQRDCNFLQAIDGEIDTSHFGFLHLGAVKLEDVPEDELSRIQITNRTPEYHYEDTPWGMMYGAYRHAGNGRDYWRIGHFLFPCFTMVPNGALTDLICVRAWVPLDDTHTMFVQVSWKQRPLGSFRAIKSGKPPADATLDFKHLPNTTDWLGRWRLTQNAANDYGIDRARQRHESFTGIERIHSQDQAVNESMGPIVDRRLEHLAPPDQMIVHMRKRLARAVQALSQDGTLPPGIEDPNVYLRARSGHFLCDAPMDWRTAYRQQIEAAANPTGQLIAADA